MERPQLGGVTVRLSAIALTAAVCLLFPVRSAVAQTEPHQHQGFWWGIGLGWGLNVTTGLDAGRTLNGPALTLRAGGTLSSKLLLGGDLVFWSTEDFDANLFRANTTLSLFYYPIPQNGFYVKGGIGLGRVGADLPVAGGTQTEAQAALGATLGGGFDVPVGANLYLTPSVSWLFQWFEELGDTSFNSLIVLSVDINAH